MEALYLDTSAAVKLFKQEPESAALDQWLAGRGSALVLTSDLTRCELRRALEAAGAGPGSRREAEEWLADCALIRLSRELCDRAGTLAPGVRLRSLDALHTAAALSLGRALAAFVAYDQRLVDAAKQAGLPVSSPA
ncbi:MAG: type II toxin-antitoxin system VapC family toxin [Streptosporangiaceae bacterium]|nr:type II toxin-antitoxin system VapC family toxin [Streptosporangiaceae bacterium]